MKKRLLGILLALCCCILFFGCSRKKENMLEAGEVKVNTLLINSNGTVQSSLVEEFNKSYYVKSELEDYIRKEIEKYNRRAGTEAVSMHSLEVTDGVASVVFNYADLSHYADFNHVEALLTTVSELSDILPGTLLSADKNEETDKDTILEKNGKMKAVVVEEELDVIVSGKVKYFSNGALLNKNTVQTPGDGTSIIIFK